VPQIVGARSAAVQSVEDRWYVSEYRSPGVVDSTPFGWFIRPLHFTLPGECQKTYSAQL